MPQGSVDGSRNLSRPSCPHPQSAAAQVLALIATRLCDAPYCVVAHSVGTWIAFEMLALAREAGLPMPLRVFFSCFPAPSLPVPQRPWKVRALACERRAACL